MEKFFLIQDGEVVECQLPTGLDREVASFPSDYFKQHETKPRVKVYRYPDEDVANARKKMAIDIEASTLTIDFVSAYMWRYMKEIEDKLQDKWESHGQIIGEDGAKITPQDLLEPEFKSIRIGVQKGDDKTDAEGWGMFWTLVAAFRLINIGTDRRQDEYLQTTARRLESHFQQSPWNAGNIKQVARANARLGDRLEYTALIGALDMFFNKFPGHEFSGSRNGTITSRNKGAAGLNSLYYIRNFTKMSYGKLFTYLPYAPLEPELRRMGKPEEQDLAHSYTHYIKVMGICKVSPYSSAANPLTYMLFHIIGSCWGVERSYNAADISTSDRAALLKLGVTAAYFLTGSATFTPKAGEAELMARAGGIKRVVHEHKTAQEMMIELGEKLDIEDVPAIEHGDGRDVLNALNIMTEIPLPWRRTISAKLNQAGTRPGSVGRMLLNSLGVE